MVSRFPVEARAIVKVTSGWRWDGYRTLKQMCWVRKWHKRASLNCKSPISLWKMNQLATHDPIAASYAVTLTITSALCKKCVNNRLKDTNWLNTSCLISFVLLLKSKQWKRGRLKAGQASVRTILSPTPLNQMGHSNFACTERGSFQKQEAD